MMYPTSVRGHSDPSRLKKKLKEKEKDQGKEADDAGAVAGEETPKEPKEGKDLRRKVKDIVDPQTEKNTRFNALLYHTSDETIDMYKQENNSSDLLGRLYYDDYDSESVTSPILSGSATPLLSPTGSGGSGYFGVLGGAGTPSSDHFQARLLAINSASSHSIRPSSSTNLSSLNPRSSPSSLQRSSSYTQVTGLSAPPSLDHVSGIKSPASFHLATPPASKSRSLERGISFDTSTDDHRRSLTFKIKHPQFKFRRNNKTFLTGFNNDLESVRAIEWLFDEMIVHGDTIIVLQVLDEKRHINIDKAQANKVLGKIELLNLHYKKVQIVFEVVIGKPQKALKNAIDEFNPQMMCIGTHHSNKDYHKKSFLSKASFSKHFLECALVPVIVVKPTYRHIEYLETPVDSEDYFMDLIKSIVPAPIVAKDKQKRMLKLNPLSPSSSRPGSYTNLAALSADRGRNASGENNKTEDDDRGRDDLSRSSSRSRSRSRSKSHSGFSKFFHGH